MLTSLVRAQVTGLLDPELVEALPKSLQFIAHNGAGYECVALAVEPPRARCRANRRR